MPATYTSVLSVQVSDFEDNCLLIQHDRLICDSCSSGQRFACGFLQPTPRDANLAVRLILPPAGCIEDLHLQVSAPCRAHNKKREASPLLPFSQQIISCLYISCCHKGLCHCPLFHHPNRVLCCLLTVISRLRHHVITIWATWTISMKAIFNHCFLHMESGLFNFRCNTISIIEKHPHGI